MNKDSIPDKNTEMKAKNNDFNNTTTITDDLFKEITNK